MDWLSGLHSSCVASGLVRERGEKDRERERGGRDSEGEVQVRRRVC